MERSRGIEEVLSAKNMVEEDPTVLNTAKKTKAKMMGWKMNKQDFKNNGCMVNQN